MRVNEIFYSIQGEGRWAGSPAVFLRLSGCNLACPFCDTNHESFSEMSLAEIVDRICDYPARMVVITGGEPTLQLSESLLAALKVEGFRIHLETNGSHAVPEAQLSLLDWITVSPKSMEVNIGRVDELKVLYQGQALEPFEVLSESLGMPHLSLQPLDTGDPVANAALVDGAVEAVKRSPRWTLSLQLHKLLNIK